MPVTPHGASPNPFPEHMAARFRNPPDLRRTTAHTTLLVALLALVLAGPVAADETRHFDWLIGGRISGQHVLTLRDDGTREVDFAYADRGRGPRIFEVVRFDHDGRVVAIDIEGEAYMGGPVEEHFRVEDGVARWDSLQESGSRANPGEAVYLAANGSSEHLAILARALLAAGGGPLPLLPSGEAAIERVARTTLGPPGGERRLELYALSGLDLLPTYLWLDEERELFALSQYWMGLVPQGWAAWLPDLERLQQAAEARHLAGLARSLTRELPAEYVLADVQVVDVESGVLLPGRHVLVRDGRIAGVSERPPCSPGIEIVDGEGGYLLPGFWDMHTHLGAEQGLQHIAAGVTTVRDVGNDPADQRQLRELFEGGGAIGPRVLAAGFIDRRSDYSAPIGRLVDSLGEALAMVREFAAQGYPQVKLYSSVDPAWVAPIAAEARRLGLRLSGHVPNGMSAEQAVRAGFDEIHHVNMLFLNFLAGPDVDTRTPARVTLVAERGAGLDLDSRPVREFLALLRRREVVVDPTLALFDGMFRHRPGEVNPAYAAVADHLPPNVRRSLLASIMDVSEENAQRYAAGARALVRMVGRLHAEGIRVVAGTDAMPGFLYHRELELYGQAGIAPAEVLRLATLGAAEVMGLASDSGSIRPGKRADLVLLADNPLADLGAVRRALLVIRGQRAWRPAALHRAMGVRPFVAPGPEPGMGSGMGSESSARVEGGAPRCEGADPIDSGT